MNKTNDEQTRIWWVVDENDNHTDFFSFEEWCEYIGNKMRDYKKRKYAVSTKVANGSRTSTFTFTKGSDKKSVKMTEIRF